MVKANEIGYEKVTWLENSIEFLAKGRVGLHAHQGYVYDMIIETANMFQPDSDIYKDFQCHEMPTFRPGSVSTALTERCARSELIVIVPPCSSATSFTKLSPRPELFRPLSGRGSE